MDSAYIGEIIIGIPILDLLFIALKRNLKERNESLCLFSIHIFKFKRNP